MMFGRILLLCYCNEGQYILSVNLFWVRITVQNITFIKFDFI